MSSAKSERIISDSIAKSDGADKRDWPIVERW